jgi:hypothetical protein
MWNTFYDRGKELASKAAAAAKDLDNQLNESVGIPNNASVATASASVSASATASSVHDNDDNEDAADVWADDYNMDSPVTSAAQNLPESITSKLPPIPSVQVQEDEEEEETDGAPSPSAPSEPEDQSKTQTQSDEQQHDDGYDENNLQLEEVEVDSSTEPSPKSEQQEETYDVEDNYSVPDEKQEQEHVPPSSPDEPSPDRGAVKPANETSTDTNVNLSEEQQVPESESIAAPSPPAPTKDDDDAVVVEESNVDAWVEENGDDDLELDQEDQTIIAVEPEPLSKPQSHSQPQPQAVVLPEQVKEAPVEVSNVAELNDNDAPSEQHVSSSQLDEQLVSQQEITRQLEHKMVALQQQLQQREDQLVSKTEQMSTVQAMHESEKQELQSKIQNTKAEAKTRIQKARERVEAMEAKLQNVSAVSNSTAGDAAQQAEMIVALRAEGEHLARKQSEMEQAVRSAKGEARSLRQELEEEMAGKDNALEKIAKLETDLKATKDSLSAARRGESQAGKLESGLQQAREESERKSASILSLEQQVKEFKAETKELHIDLEAAMKGAAVDNERDQKKWRKEHHDAVEDLENKLRISEREAGVREDALRHEVAELRKRWQDAVSRADSLSMDSQSSTAPLLRQLDSIHRQNRARASAWAELETKLRSELEENVITNEKLSRERSDLKTKCNRFERTANELEGELKATKSSLEEKSVRVKVLEEKLADMETEGAKMKEEWAEVERLANEGVSRVRSEMTVTVVENEERHRFQLDTLEAELRQEREKRSQLEGQVENLIKNAELIVPQGMLQQSAESNQSTKPKRLRQSEGQADILAGALTGLGGEDSDDDDDDDDDGEDLGGENGGRNSGSGGSFAALEELTSRLKAARVELNTLRMSFADAEKSRKELAEELGEARNAKEKLPLFEAKVSELTSENNQQSLELQALQEDIVEVREMYRTQLNLLLEEKAAAAVAAATAPKASPIANGTSVVLVEESIQSEDTSNEEMQPEDATDDDVSSE